MKECFDKIYEEMEWEKEVCIYCSFLFVLIFSSPGRSPGRAVVLPPALAFVLALASALAKC